MQKISAGESIHERKRPEKPHMNEMSDQRSHTWNMRSRSGACEVYSQDQCRKSSHCLGPDNTFIEFRWFRREVGHRDARAYLQMCSRPRTSELNNLRVVTILFFKMQQLLKSNVCFDARYAWIEHLAGLLVYFGHVRL